MGPIRGSKKKQKIDNENGLSKEGSSDWWNELNNKTVDSISPSKGVDEFELVFKVSRKTFNYICSLVSEPMMAKTANFVFSNGKSLSLNDQVALALRRLSTGDSLKGVAKFFGTTHNIVYQVTWRFVQAIEKCGLHHLQWPSTEEEMTLIKSKFENIRGLPNCCGVIDTTHILMLLSASDETADVWLDRKDNHSTILQVIVDPDMRFRDIVSGYPGKMDDALVLQKSYFFGLSEKRERLNGNKLKLPEGTKIQEYIVGDTGFPLLPWLITPYQGEDLSKTKTEFNKRHFATRLVAQRALTRLKDAWRIIHGVMWRPDRKKLPRVILACCILHNIVIDMEDDVLEELTLTTQHDLGYRPEVCDIADKKASLSRDKLALYLAGRLSA